MESAPKGKGKKILHIDSRTIEEIALDNKRLKDKLKYNLECLNMKRKELHENKHKESFNKLLEKNRKIFAFRCNIDTPIPEDKSNLIKNTINDLLAKNKAKICKIFTMNNFIYIKTNINIVIRAERLDLPDGNALIQINPKSIFTQS